MVLISKWFPALSKANGFLFPETMYEESSRYSSPERYSAEDSYSRHDRKKSPSRSKSKHKRHRSRSRSPPSQYRDSTPPRQYRDSNERDTHYEDDEEDGFKVYVGDLEDHTTMLDIEHAFKVFGTLRELFMPAAANYAFVKYWRREDADEAIRKMNGSELAGRRVRVSLARPKSYYGGWRGRGRGRGGRAWR